MKLTSAYLVVVTLLLLRPLSSEAGGKRTFIVDGHPIAVVVEKLTPPVEIVAQTSARQPVIDACLRYYKLLASGDIAKAAEQSASPDVTRKQMTAYMERLGGAAAFRAMMGKFFTSKLRFTYVLELGDAAMLLGEHPEHGTFANFFTCANGTCKLEEAVDRPALKELGALFDQLRAGKTRL